jgi:hypothetical protein
MQDWVRRMGRDRGKRDGDRAGRFWGLPLTTGSSSNSTMRGITSDGGLPSSRALDDAYAEPSAAFCWTSALSCSPRKAGSGPKAHPRFGLHFPLQPGKHAPRNGAPDGGSADAVHTFLSTLRTIIGRCASVSVFSNLVASPQFRCRSHVIGHSRIRPSPARRTMANSTTQLPTVLIFRSNWRNAASWYRHSWRGVLGPGRTEGPGYPTATNGFWAGSPAVYRTGGS